MESIYQGLKVLSGWMKFPCQLSPTLVHMQDCITCGVQSKVLCHNSNWFCKLPIQHKLLLICTLFIVLANVLCISSVNGQHQTMHLEMINFIRPIALNQQCRILKADIFYPLKKQYDLHPEQQLVHPFWRILNQVELCLGTHIIITTCENHHNVIQYTVIHCKFLKFSNRSLNIMHP
jgi:hypothetical protein